MATNGQNHARAKLRTLLHSTRRRAHAVGELRERVEIVKAADLIAWAIRRRGAARRDVGATVEISADALAVGRVVGEAADRSLTRAIECSVLAAGDAGGLSQILVDADPRRMAGAQKRDETGEP